MKTYWIFLMLFLFGNGPLSLPAQADLYVLRTVGRVEYVSSQDARPVRLVATNKITARGSVVLYDGASLKLRLDDQTIDLNEKGIFSLPVLVKEKGKEKNLGFFGRFWAFVAEGISNTDDTYKVEKYHQQYLSKGIGGGIEGFASNFGIHVHQLPSGRLGDTTLVLSWDSTGLEAPFQTRIVSERDGREVWAAITPQTTCTLQLDTLAAGETYRLFVVQETADTVLSSGGILFQYDPIRQQRLFEQLQKTSEFQEALPVEQSLMRAHALESRSYLYGADAVYRQLLSELPENELIRRMYAAFLLRHDRMENAERMLAQPTPENSNQ